MTLSDETDRKIQQQAAEWIVQLTDDDPDRQQQARMEFDLWKQIDPRHAKAAEKLEHFINHIQDIQQQSDPKIAHSALRSSFRKPRKYKKLAGATLALLLLIGLPLTFSLQHYAFPHLTADLRTHTGVWQQKTLADGTLIFMNGGTAVNLEYSKEQRLLHLLSGEILVNVATDKRPLSVQTRHGNIRALGTEFIVRQSNRDTELTMLESRVLVRATSQQYTEGQEVVAGFRVQINDAGISELHAIDPAMISHAWHNQQLVVQDQSLPDVLEQINRHHTGYLRYNPEQLQHISVSGALPLNDTHRAIQLLADNFPELKIRHYSPFYTVINLY